MLRYKKTFSKALLAAVLAVGVIPTACGFDRTLSIDWTLGEADSIARVRSLAVDALRQRAMDHVGKIVESTATLSDGQLTEDVRLIGVALVQATETVWEVIPGKPPVLRVQARIVVDESELARRAEAIRTDHVKASELRRLREDNHRLRSSLLDLHRRIKGQGGRDLIDITTREALLLGEIQANLDSVSQVFKPGELNQMAFQDRERWSVERAYIDTTVVPFLMTPKAAIHVSNVQLADGNTVAVVFSLKWEYDFERLVQLWARYSAQMPTYLPNFEREYVIHNPTETSVNPPPFGVRAFDRLNQVRPVLILSMAGRSLRFPITRNESKRISILKGSVSPLQLTMSQTQADMAQWFTARVDATVDGEQLSTPIELSVTRR